MCAQCIFAFFSRCKTQSHIVDARPTHWKLNIFCQSVGRASVVRQHSLLVREARCTNATHIGCVQNIERISTHKHARKLLETSGALWQRYIKENTLALYHMAARWERRAVAINAPALRCMSARSKRWVHAGGSPSVRATGCDYVISAA